MPPEPTSTRAEFAARVIAEMRALGLQGDITHDEIAGTLVHGERGPFDLEAAYRHFTGPTVRPDNDEMLRRVVRFYVRPPAVPLTWAEVRTRVVPTIAQMARQVSRAFEVERGTEKHVHRYAVVTDHITAEVGYPIEDGTVGVSDEFLGRWGIGFEEAMNQATTNLLRKGTPKWKVSPDYPGVFRSPWSDGFDASRILLPQAMRSLPVRGDPVLILHAPSCVLAAGADDPDALFQLGRCARKQWETNRGSHITRPIRRTEGQWKHWMPANSHPAHSLLRLMEALAEKRDYDELQSVTRERLQRPNIQIATPPVHIVQSPLGDTRTTTTWTDRTATALPIADGIVFKRGGETLGVAEFEAVRTTLGSELEPLAVYPKRLLGRTFPAEWQLASMGMVPWRQREA